MEQKYDYSDQLEYISQAKTIDVRIKTVVELLRLCNEEVAYIKPYSYDMPKVQMSICKTALEEQVFKMIERKEVLSKELEDLMRLKNELYSVVTSIGNNDARTCLRMIFFENVPVHTFATRLRISDRTAYRRIKDAIGMIRIPNSMYDTVRGRS